MWRYIFLLSLIACTEEVADTGYDCAEEELLILYEDADDDGFGTLLFPVRSCTYVEGYVYNSEDCDDSNELTYPGALEKCDDEDNNCDGVGDEVQTWYPDLDGDGFGAPGTTIDDCVQPEGYAANRDDCNDESAVIYPDAEDLCDGLDNDCDGLFDEDSKVGWSLMSVDHKAEAIWEIELATGALGLVSTMNITTEEIPTMDTRGDGYALVYDAAAKMLLEVDACNGALTPVGGASGVGRTCGIAFGPGGELYGLDNDANTLVVFDPQTGVGTTIGEIGFKLGPCGLTYDCSTDTLIGADANTNEIFELDVVTGLASNVIQTDIPFNSVGLEFDAQTGMILASTNQSFYEVDPTTGFSTRLGDFQVGTHMNDLAYHPPCP
jgi:hypothetical protein